MTETATEAGERMTRRLAIVLDLRLEGPAHFGGGEGDGTDAAVLVDATGVPFIPGSTLAGVLRSHLRWRLLPSGANPDEQKFVEDEVLARLFGRLVWRDKAGPSVGPGRAKEPEDEWAGSALTVEDAYPLGIDPTGAADGARPELELRDSVAIDAKTRTAREQAKFDHEVIVGGTTFRARLLLETRAEQAEFGPLQRAALNLLLDALEQGEVRLGARARSGFGGVKASGCVVRELDLQAWLNDADLDLVPAAGVQERAGLTPPGQPAPSEEQQRRIEQLLRPLYDLATLTVAFRLRGPLLIRSALDAKAPDAKVPDAKAPDAKAPDAVHLRSGGEPVVSGPTLRGVLRGAAQRVALTLSDRQRERNPSVAAGLAGRLVDDLFGPELKGMAEGKVKPRAGLIAVDEAVLQASLDYEQVRIRIDRFTGGVLGGFLFSERPAYPRDDEQPNFTLRLRVREWKAEHLGLVLQVIKDLWLGTLALGGGANVGRGTLEGRWARLELVSRGSEPDVLEWEAAADEQEAAAGHVRFTRGSVERFKKFEQALIERLGGERGE